MEKKYPIGGYAPGNYNCTCATCNTRFHGNKRAVQCEPCAVADKERFDAMTTEEQKELLRRNSMIAHLMFEYAGAGEQIVANQLAGMSLEEATFQSGYSAGHDTGYERGKREAVRTGPKWVKASEFKHEAGMPYHAKDSRSKGAGMFNKEGAFIWGDSTVTWPKDQNDLLILDEKG
jgi:hypothetical protein